jgi:EAL domain
MTLVALAGLATLALLLLVTLRALRDILGLWHQVTTADARIAVLETSALMSQAQPQVPRPRAHDDSGIALDQLTLEITERAAVTEYDEITPALLVLRERGVQLAVDDMGAGYASFSHGLRASTTRRASTSGARTPRPPPGSRGQPGGGCHRAHACRHCSASRDRARLEPYQDTRRPLIGSTHRPARDHDGRMPT